MHETRLNSRDVFPYPVSFPVYLRWKTHMKKLKYKWRTKQEKTAVFRHLDPILELHPFIQDSMTTAFCLEILHAQLLKNKQSTKGKKREGKMSSWESLAERALTSAHNTSTCFSIFPTGIWVIPEFSGWTQRNEKALAPPHSFAKPGATKVSLVFTSSFFAHTLLLSTLPTLHLMLQRLNRNNREQENKATSWKLGRNKKKVSRAQ